MDLVTYVNSPEKWKSCKQLIVLIIYTYYVCVRADLGFNNNLCMSSMHCMLLLLLFVAEAWTEGQDLLPQLHPKSQAVVLKKVKKIFKGAKFVTKEETKSKDPDDDSGTSSAQSTTTSKDQFVQYYAPALPPMSTYYYHPNQLWPYSYPTPLYNYPLITYRPWMNLHTHLFNSIEFASILAYWLISLSMAQN